MKPSGSTLATLVFEDRQLACDVTFCVEPFESVAIAVNGALKPTLGAVPPTATDVTETVDTGGDGEGGVVEPLPHAQNVATIAIETMTPGGVQRTTPFTRAAAPFMIDAS